jgi:hypothetical protein
MRCERQEPFTVAPELRLRFDSIDLCLNCDGSFGGTAQEKNVDATAGHALLLFNDPIAR